MGLTMKNFNMGVHWKIRFLEGHEKPIYWEELLKKGGLGQFTDIREEFRKKGGDVFDWSWGAFLLTPRLIGIKYPKQITLCDTNTVIVLIIIIIIDT